VATRHELRDELSAENACRASYEDLHDCSSRFRLPLWDETEEPPVTVLSELLDRRED
jgi:hypothetical protein